MITPEEVINYSALGPLLATHLPAAMFDLGRSPWLESFAPRHLAKCHHFRLLFHDQLVDAIAEGVEVGLAESMPFATVTIHLGAAGNVEAPAWLELLARGYRVQAGPRWELRTAVDSNPQRGPHKFDGGEVRQTSSASDKRAETSGVPEKF